MRSYLRERFAGAPFPAAMGLACGHRESPRTLPLGVAARLDCDGRRELSFSGAAVQ
jgi:muramoyltetrapeptide carboxypeptidase LdcA involved in peptidoglycan recycling